MLDSETMARLTDMSQNALMDLGRAKIHTKKIWSKSRSGWVVAHPAIVLTSSCVEDTTRTWV